MSLYEQYAGQVHLILNVLPEIAREEVFALKGGTAINLFYRDMPRLSVDIDLTYLPTSDRATALRDIETTLGRIIAAIADHHPHIRVRPMAGGGGNDTQIVMRSGQAQVKLETSPVTRGTVYSPQSMTTSEGVTDNFAFVEMNVLAFEDLYGGKLHAALDRQHPRDLFDIKLLYENEGITDELFRVFMVYVASSNRPMHELLAPNMRLSEEQYNNHFIGMTREFVSMDALIEAQEQLHKDIQRRLTGDISAFLLSLHDAEPDFSLIGLPGAGQLPAVRWRLMNLEKLKRSNPEKHAAQRDALEELL